MRRYIVVANQTLGGEELHPLRPSAATPARAASTWSCSSPTPKPPIAGSRAGSRARRVPTGSPGPWPAGGYSTSSTGSGRPGSRPTARWSTRCRWTRSEIASREEADEVIVSTLPRRLSRWMAMDLPHRIRRATSSPSPTSPARPAPPLAANQAARHAELAGARPPRQAGERVRAWQRVAVRETSSPAATRRSRSRPGAWPRRRLAPGCGGGGRMSATPRATRGSRKAAAMARGEPVVEVELQAAGDGLDQALEADLDAGGEAEQERRTQRRPPTRTSTPGPPWRNTGQGTVAPGGVDEAGPQASSIWARRRRLVAPGGRRGPAAGRRPRRPPAAAPPRRAGPWRTRGWWSPGRADPGGAGGDPGLGGGQAAAGEQGEPVAVGGELDQGVEGRQSEVGWHGRSSWVRLGEARRTCHAARAGRRASHQSVDRPADSQLAVSAASPRTWSPTDATRAVRTPSGTAGRGGWCGGWWGGGRVGQ